MNFRNIAVILCFTLVGCNDNSESNKAVTQIPKTDYQLGLSNVRDAFLGSSAQRSDAIYDKFNFLIHEKAAVYLSQLEVNSDTSLWPDLQILNYDEDKTYLVTSQPILFSSERLRVMAAAYVTPGPLYLDKDLLAKLRIALDIFVKRFYTADGTQWDGWYEWQIGVPRELMLAVAYLDGYLGEDLVARITASVSHYINVDTIYGQAQGSSTGANRIDQAWALLINGLLKENTEDIAQAKTVFRDSTVDRFNGDADPSSPAAFGVGLGDGFKKDNGYLFHADLPYTMGYGLDELNRAANILLTLADTPFDFSAQEKDRILDQAFTQVFKGYMPWMKDGIGIDSVAGRAIFRGFEQNHGKGHWAMEGLLKFYLLADMSSNSAINAERKETLGTFIKSFLINDSDFYAKHGANNDETYVHDITYYATEALSITTARAILENGSIAYVKEPLTGNFLYPQMNRVIHRTDNFSFVIAAHSNTVGNYEIVGNEGQFACYSADGMTYLYDQDLDQYMNYWNTFDWTRPAGVTNDNSIPQNPRDCAWTTMAQKTSLIWSGGVSAGDEGFGSYGFGYKDWHWIPGGGLSGRTSQPWVEANKSWFMFDDRIVALGSDIKCNHDCERSALETTLDNRKYNTAPADSAVLINGTPWTSANKTENVASMLIEGDAAGSQLGIVFPNPVTVNTLKEKREGDWLLHSGRASDFMKKGTRTEATFIRTSLSHTEASNNSYRYVLLPGATQQMLNRYIEQPTISILANTDTVHAVKDLQHHVFAMNVFAKPTEAYLKNTADIIRAYFLANGLNNTDYTPAVAQQLFDEYTQSAEHQYGLNGEMLTSAEVALMTKQNGDELTLWVSQPSRRLMHAIVDLSNTNLNVAALLSGDNTFVSSDGKKLLIGFDLMVDDPIAMSMLPRRVPRDSPGWNNALAGIHRGDGMTRKIVLKVSSN